MSKIAFLGPRVYIFWDNSNIFISAKSVAEQLEPGVPRRDVRVHFNNLFRLAVAGRPVAKAVAVGSIPPDQRSLWNRLEADTGIAIELHERGNVSHTEQAIDSVLQVQMLRAGMDEADPQTVVLLTGDGAGYEVGIGFHADLERMQEKGWGIEVLSWEHSCKRALRDWANRVGVFVRLEDYYKSITFLEGTRSPMPLSLLHRRTANPVISKAVIKQRNIDRYNKKLKRREFAGKRTGKK